MQGEITLQWGGNDWILDASGACYLPKFESLIVSDFHIGKVQHFRKHGIAIPTAAARANMGKLDGVLAKYRPKQLLFLGDLFHSDLNSEIGLLQQLRQVQADLKILLVPGNHDRQTLSLHAGLFEVTAEQYEMGGMIFQHHPPEGTIALPTIHGHWHPAVSIKSGGRQRLRLACFAFSEQTAVLPAFGLFTGKADLPSVPAWKQLAVLSKEGIQLLPASLLR
jgi:DNA ligase-associated metallophosphoesterase